MRFYLGHRLPGGFYGAIGVGSYGQHFHPRRVLVANGSAVAENFAEGFKFAFIATLLIVFLLPFFLLMK